MANQNVQIKRYDTLNTRWDEINPKTLAELVKYDATHSIKDIVDGKVTKVVSTDNAVVKFNGTAGEVQNTGVTVDDSNNVATPGSVEGLTLKIKNANSKTATIDATALTADTAVALPNKTGTLAMLSDIPTVGNGTITIQKNGTTVSSFTVNQSGPSTINIQDVASAATLSSHTGNTNNPHGVTCAQISAIHTNQKAAANGVATLDENTKIPLAQIPDSILGNMTLGGTVTYVESTLTAELSANGKAILARKTGKTVGDTVTIKNQAADEGTTTLTALGWVSAEGLYFIAQNSFDVTVEGITYHFEVGDWLISIGTGWRKIDNTDAVVSVNGKTGAVTLYGTDILLTSSSGASDTVTANINTLNTTKQNKLTTSGSSSIKPIYVSADGVIAAADKYAGGTRVTLNGTDKGTQTASFYAPIVAGTKHKQALIWNGTYNQPMFMTYAEGSSTYPIYINSDGCFATGSQYAGGTAVTLNGDSKSGNTAAFYAPTGLGTGGQVLATNSAGTALEWITPSTFTDTWRGINVNGTSFLGTGTGTGPLNFKNGTNISFNTSTAGTLEISATEYSAGAGISLDTTTHKFKLAIAMGTTAPSDPGNGCIWFDTAA